MNGQQKVQSGNKYTIKIAELCYDWLKHGEMVGISFALSYACTRRKQMSQALVYHTCIIFNLEHERMYRFIAITQEKK